MIGADKGGSAAICHVCGEQVKVIYKGVLSGHGGENFDSPYTCLGSFTPPQNRSDLP